MEFYFQILGFQYFEFLYIYERILNRIRISIFGVFVLALINTISYITQAMMLKLLFIYVSIRAQTNIRLFDNIRICNYSNTIYSFQTNYIV